MKNNSHAKGPIKEGQRNQNYYPTHADYVDKLKETINEVSEENAKEYELPAATSETLGGVKIGENITNEDGKISVPNADSNVAGVAKLYDNLGENTDGAVTQKAVKVELDKKLDSTAQAISATKATQDSEGNVIRQHYAPINSPNFTGTPTAPGYDENNLDDNPNQIATRGYANALIRRLLGADLNTIKLIYDLQVALNQDKNFSEAIVQALNDKLGKNDNAASASRDGNGNVIHTTYATKTDLSNVSVSKLNDRVEFYNGTQYKGFLDTGHDFAGTWNGIASGFGLIASNDGTTQHSGINFGPHYASIWASNTARGGSDVVEIALYINDYSKGQCVKITAPGGLYVNDTRIDQ